MGCYADDLWLWYEITNDNRDIIIDVINQDLDGLLQWVVLNKTTFEPSKTFMMLVSNHTTRQFDLSGVHMDGFEVERVHEMKITGFLFDSKLLWSAHIDMLVSKAKQRLGALRNLKPILSSDNMKTMYMGFVRSILEYGNVLYMGAADAHLDKLEAVQRSAMKLGGFAVEPLSVRREAAAAALCLKLLDQACSPGLNKFAPKLVHGHYIDHTHNTTSTLGGIQLKPLVLSKYSLDRFLRSFLGSIHSIWAKLPQSAVVKGSRTTWRHITNERKLHLRFQK